MVTPHQTRKRVTRLYFLDLRQQQPLAPQNQQQKNIKPSSLNIGREQRHRTTIMSTKQKDNKKKNTSNE